MHSKGAGNIRSTKARSVRPNFLMAKEKAIMDAAKILEMDFNTGGGSTAIGNRVGEASLVQTAFRMPTPTHQDKAKIMAGAELIKAVK